MKKTITLIALSCFALTIQAQNIVTTNNTNRVAIIEEFTGTSCPACPSGHTEMSSILSSNPNTVFGVAYSPTNSSLTGPYSGGLDLTNSFPNPFYTNPYYGNGAGRSMPSGHINRTKYDTPDFSGCRKSSVSQWASRAAGIISQASPVNIGVSSNHDPSTNMVDVTVEVYFTSNVNSDAYITVLLLENDIITTQAGASGNISHKHLLRANLQSGQWGDAIGGTSQGDLNTMTFSFDNAAGNYVIGNCDILAFVSTGTDDNSEIITGYQVKADGGSGSVTNVNNIALNDSDIKLFPNPTNNEIYLVLNNKALGASIVVTNVTGKKVFSTKHENTSNNVVSLTKSNLNIKEGTYFVTISNENGSTTKKVIIK